MNTPSPKKARSTLSEITNASPPELNISLANISQSPSKVLLGSNSGISLKPLTPKRSPVSAGSAAGFSAGGVTPQKISPLNSPCTKSPDGLPEQQLPELPLNFSPTKLRGVIGQGSEERVAQYLRTLNRQQLQDAAVWIGLCAYPDCDRYGKIVDNFLSGVEFPGCREDEALSRGASPANAGAASGATPVFSDDSDDEAEEGESEGPSDEDGTNVIDMDTSMEQEQLAEETGGGQSISDIHTLLGDIRKSDPSFADWASTELGAEEQQADGGVVMPRASVASIGRRLLRDLWLRSDLHAHA